MADSLPFNAIKVDGEFDRAYKAEDWAWYFATFLASGVFPKPSDGLQVEAYSGMEVRVNMGYAFINGYAFRNPVSSGITLDRAEGVLNRVDRVVVRWDLVLRDIYIDVLKGVPSAKPVAAAITRNKEVWELALADIYIGKGVTKILTQNITDQRFNSDVCGIVVGTVKEIDASVLTKQFNDFFNTYSVAVLDEFSVYKQNMETYLTQLAGIYENYVTQTESLFAQYESEFNVRYSTFENTLDNWDAELLKAYTDFMENIQLFQTEAQNDFNAWFEAIKGQLGEDAAGQLQLEINRLTADVQEFTKTCAEKDETLQEQIEECVAKDETLQAQIEECAEENETLQAQIEAINAATYKHGTKVLGEPKSVFLISIDKVDMDKSYLEYDPSQGYDPELYLYLNEGLTFNPDTQVLCFNNPNNAFSADDFRGNSSSSGQSYWNYEYNNSAFFLDIRDNAGNNLMNLWVNNNIQYQYGFNSTFSDADDFISQITENGTTYGKSNIINNYYAVYGGDSAVLPNEYRTLPPVTVNEQQLGFLRDKTKDGYIEYLLDCVNGKNLLATRYYTFPNVTTNQTTGTYQEISLKNGTKYRFSADIKSIVGNVTHVMYRITNSSAAECGFGNVRQLTVNNGKISDEFTTPPGSTYLNQDYKRLYIYSGFVSGNGPRRIAWENMMLKEII